MKIIFPIICILLILSCSSPSIEICVDNENTVKVIHFSIDDCNTIFKNITQKKYNSIFEEPLLAKLKTLHEQYGLKVCLYVFYSFNGFCIDSCSNNFTNEFKQNSDWLQLAPHAFDEQNISKQSISLNKMVECLANISGKQCITSTVRLDKFQGTRQELEQTKILKSFLTADNPTRNSYYIGNNKSLNENEFYADTLKTFYRTDFRLDNPDEFKELFSENKCENCIVFFTHEWLLENPMRLNLYSYIKKQYKINQIWDNLEYICIYAKANNYKFVTDLNGIDYGK